MDHSIISRDLIRRKARTAFAKGLPRDAHNMNPASLALQDWLDEYDRCADAAQPVCEATSGCEP